MAAEPSVLPQWAEAEISMLRMDLENVERALRTERRKYSTLQAKFNQQAWESPARDKASELFEFWKAQTNHPRSILTPDRIRAAEQAFKWGYTMERLRMACVGIGASAFEKDGKRYDDFELMLRDGKNIERFEEAGRMALADPDGPGIVTDPWFALHEILVDVNGGPGAVDIHSGDELFDCPRCDTAQSLAFGIEALSCRTCGAGKDDVISSLRRST